MTNSVYIATSLDGYIADRNGELGWLELTPNPDHLDFGWADFMKGIDALVMGRITFETICGFDVEWPYSIPVFVLSNTLSSIPSAYNDKAEVISGKPSEVVSLLSNRGFEHLYIDGGKTIQSFLQADLIDELIITRLPILLGGGASLFDRLSQEMLFEHVSTEVLLDEMVKTHYRRRR